MFCKAAGDRPQESMLEVSKSLVAGPSLDGGSTIALAPDVEETDNAGGTKHALSVITLQYSRFFFSFVIQHRILHIQQ